MKNHLATLSPKPLFVTALLLLMITNVFATIRTVYNNVPNPGQFGTILNAYNASLAGDTIYILPSPITYTGIAISKKITIIGGGYATEKPNTFSTAVTNFTLSAGCEGSVINGLYVTNGIAFTALTTYNVTISRCYFPNTGLITFNVNSGSLQNIQYNECMFDNMNIDISSTGNFTSQANIVFNNCVMRVTNSTNSFISQTGASNVTALINWNFNQCLFYGFNSGSNTISSVYKYNWGGTFSGCIFNKVYLSNINGASFTNCLTYTSNPTNIWDVNSNQNLNTLGTNLVNQDPQFSTTNVQSGNANPFGGHDYYRMNATSPTRVANHSGATYEIGPFGGIAFAPNIIFVKGAISDLPSIEPSLLSQYYVQGIEKKFGEVKVVDPCWSKENLFSVAYIIKNNGHLIGSLDFIFIGDDSFYVVNSTALCDNPNKFIGYLDVFMEIMYSIKYKRNEAFV